MKERMKKTRGEHCINIFVSYELKEKISDLAKKYDRTMADIVRTLLRVGIPILEGISEAEKKLLDDYVKVIRKWRKVKEMKIDEPIPKEDEKLHLDQD